MSLEQIVPWATLACVSCLIWVAFQMLTARKADSSDRLEEMLGRSKLADANLFKHKGMTQRSHVELLVEKSAPGLSRFLEPSNAGERNVLKQRLSNAGFHGPQALPIFLAIKMCLMGGLIFIASGGALAAWGLSQNSALASFAGAALGLVLPNVVLGWMGKARQERIFLTLPSALDLLVIGVEVGRGLDVAFREVAQEMRRAAPDLCDEIELYARQLQLGRPRPEALKELGQRAGVDDLNSLTSVLIQAERFGTSIAATLRELSESMRMRRRQMAEEMAQKTSVKLLFPLVLFIFPGVFVVLVGPAAISVINEMLSH